MKIKDVFCLEEGDGRVYAHLGLEEVTETEDGAVSISMRLGRELVNSGGRGHGGIIYALCDITAAAYMRIKGTPGVTLDGSVNYYAPAGEGSTLTATCVPLKSGRTVSVLRVEVKDENGLPIAGSTISFFCC